MVGETVMKFETDIPTFERLKQCFEERYPKISANLLSADYALKELGFVKTVPCIIEVVATEEEIKVVVDDALQLEIDAYSCDEEDGEVWKLYERYGWLYDFFS